MSAGVAGLSDAELMSQLRAARAPAEGGVVMAPPSLSELSDAEILAQLGAARRTSTVPNPFRDEGPAAPASFSARFGSGPMASATDTSSGLGQGLRREADEMLVGEPTAATPALAALYRGGNALALNVPRNAAAGIATALGAVGAPGYSPRSFTQNYELAKEQEEAFARQAPKSALAGTVAGIGAGAVALPGAITATSTLGRIRQGAALGAGYGAAGEFLDSKDVGKAVAAGAIGGAVGGAAVPAVDFAVKGGKALYGMLGRGLPIARPDGSLTETTKAMLQREGVSSDMLTPDVQARIAQAVTGKGESEAAIREALAAEFAIPLSRGQATGDARAVALEQGALSGARGSRAQEVAQEFTARQAEAIEGAGGRFAERAGRGASFENPTQAVELVADRARGAAAASNAEAEAAAREAEAVLSRLRGPTPIDTLDAGGIVAQGLREAAGQGKAAYRAAYEDLAQVPGEFAPGALDRVASRVRDRLGVDVPIDAVLTPAANRALADLDNLPTLFRTEDGAGPTLGQVEQVRKRFGAYYPSTAQNATDRRALERVREEFDRTVADAAEAGLFGPRQVAQEAADGFPGAAALTGASQGSLPPAGREKAPETLIQFLGRRGGIILDDDARSADLGRIMTGSGPLARKNGRPIDDFGDELVSEGFIRPDDDTGMISRKIGDEIYDLIGLERSGQSVTRLSDMSRNVRDVGGRVADDSADYADRIGNVSGQITTELEAVGLRARDIDPDALRDASEAMMRRRFDDPTEAYEAAILAREVGEGSRAASVADDVPFDGPTSVATSSALPGATADVVEKMRLGRSLFQDYKSKFAPQGAGDDVGLAMRKIVDRDAEPVEVARMAYGGNTGLSIRIADRLKKTLGESSDYWAAHQQGYLSSIINGRDMSPKAVSDRIGAALTGERRGLTYRVLDDQQVKGLREYQQAARAAGSSREAAPEWIVNLNKSDFDPNAIMSNLFGAGVPGARPGSPAYARAIRNFVGEDSPEWSGLRFATVQKLMLKPDGSGMLPAKQLGPRILEFTDGKGSGFAKQMLEPELLAELRRFGRSVQATVYADGAMRPNDGGSAGKLAGRALDAIATGLGFQIGGVPGAGAAYTARFGSKLVQGGYQGRVARQSFEGGAPRIRQPGPVLDLAPVGTGTGLTTEYALP